MKKPFCQCTMYTATTITTAIPKAEMRVRNPTTRKSPPRNSSAMSSAAKNGGIPIPANILKVPESPGPPNKPRTFCEPCARNAIPSASLKKSIAQESSVMNRFLNTYYHPLV